MLGEVIVDDEFAFNDTLGAGVGSCEADQSEVMMV